MWCQRVQDQGSKGPSGVLLPVSPALPGSQAGRRGSEASTSCGTMALSAERMGILTCQGQGLLSPTRILVCKSGWVWEVGPYLGRNQPAKAACFYDISLPAV